MIGKQYETKNFGVAEVLENGSKYGYFKVRFFNSGTIDEFRKDAIVKGEIRDKYVATFLGIGIIGNIKTRGKYKNYYTLWRNMLNRCYNPNLSSSNSYYGKVTVCDRWLTFENFYSDLSFIDGWDIGLYEQGLLVLDKDKKQRFMTQKIYSLNTCTWLSPEENNKYQDYQQNRFKAVSPVGEVFYDYNITDFARKHNLERRQISSVLHKRHKSAEGWYFEFLDKDIV